MILLLQPGGQQSICDLIVVLVALPTLTVLGLMLESLTRENWLETTQSRMTVLGLGAGLAIICLALCMYVTSRLGKKFLWVGMQYSDEAGPHYSYYVSLLLSYHRQFMISEKFVWQMCQLIAHAHITLFNL
jgi:hypothetical protein